MRAPGAKHGLKSVALTQFPRCHIHSDPTPWADGGGQSYACMSIERDEFDALTAQVDDGSFDMTRLRQP